MEEQFFDSLLFFKAGTTSFFYHPEGNFPLSKHDLEVIISNLQMDSSQIFNIRIPIVSFAILRVVLVKISNYFWDTIYQILNCLVTSTFFGKTESSLLLLLLRENCLGKRSLNISVFSLNKQKQSLRGVPRKRCSENMQQIYRRTPMPKCDFNKVALQLY